MDESKCKALKQELRKHPEPQIIPIERFFDGNDDPGSIGCNLPDHPGMDVFQDVLSGLLNRPDVETVYAQIAELDPGEDCWPFSDTVVVVGAISADELREAVAVLQPDDVGPAENFGIASAIAQRHRSPAFGVWWD